MRIATRIPVVASIGCIWFAGLAVSVSASSPDDPQSAGFFSGQVTGPNGKPLSNARVYIIPTSKQPGEFGPARAETDAKGHFDFEARDMTYAELDGLPARRACLLFATADGYAPDWIEIPRSAIFRVRVADPIKTTDLHLQLARDDVPIHGCLLDADGRPIAGASVRVVNLIIPERGDLDAHVAREIRRGIFSMPQFEKALTRSYPYPGLVTQTQSDADGRFQLSGLGRDRLARLAISAPSIVDTEITVMTRDAPDIHIQPGDELEHAAELPPRHIYGAGFSLQLARGRTISGVVRDRDSHEPIAGMWVGLGNGHPRDGVLWHRTVTDGQGSFQITGLDPATARSDVTAASAPGMGYLSASVKAQGDSPVLIECQRGIPFHLKLIDEQGQPVTADVNYFDVLPNSQAPRGSCSPCRTPVSQASRRPDGTYQGFVVPGPGAILVRTSERRAYRPAYVDPKAFFAPGRTDWSPQDRITAYGTQNTLMVSGGLATQDDYQAIVLVNPLPDSRPLELSATVVADKPRRVSLVDSDGKPVVGVQSEGLTSFEYDYESPLRAASFPLTGLHPDRFRRIKFYHADRKLVGFLLARGDGVAPYDVCMVPWGTLKGRILDEEGKPMTAGLSATTSSQGDPKGGEFHPLETDAMGRFQIDRLVPGQNYSAQIYRKFKLVGTAFEKVVVRAGEVRDLGDIRPLHMLAGLRKQQPN